MSAHLEKDEFGQVLDIIEEEKDLKIELPSEATALIRCEQGVLIGLSSGDLVVANTAPEITGFLTEHGGHTQKVKTLVISKDETIAVSGSADDNVCVWSMIEHNQLARFEGGGWCTYCVVLTPDNKRVVSGHDDAIVRVWSLEDQERTLVLEGHIGAVKCLALNPVGDKVASGSLDKTIHLWNLADEKEEAIFEGHTGEIECIAFISNGEWIATGSADKTIGLWKIDKSRKEFLKGHTDSVTFMSITPDGARIVSGSSDKTVRVWSIAERRLEHTFSGHTEVVTCLSVFPDGSRVVSGSLDKTVRLWNLTELREEAEFKGHTTKVQCVAVTPDSYTLVSGGSERTAQLWTLSDDYKLFASIDSPVLFILDGKAVFGSFDCSVQVWNVVERRQLAKLKGHSKFVTCVAMTSDCSRVISSAEDHTIKVWDLTTQREVSSTNVGDYAVTCLAVTPDGTKFVTDLEGYAVGVWDLTEMKLERELRGHENSINMLIITPDGSKLVSSSYDKTVRVWSLADGQEEAVFRGHTDPVACIVLTPDASKVVSCSNDATIRVWSLSTHTQEKVLTGHTANVLCVAVTSDGMRVVAGSGDCTVRVWTMADGRLETTFEGHTGSVQCIAVTSDGKRIASGSLDQTVRIWNLFDRREESKFEGLVNGVSSLSVLPDQSGVVSRSWNGKLGVWHFAEHRDELADSGTANTEPTIGENSPPKTSSLLRNAIKALREGTLQSFASAKCVYPSHRFNRLHICAYYNRAALLTEYLKGGVPLITGDFGTPLTLALQRNAVKCVDAILQSFVTRLEDPDIRDRIWQQFDLITADLPLLLQCSSSLLQTFFGSLMQPPIVPALTDFITPIEPLPRTVYQSCRFVDMVDFDETAKWRREDTQTTKDLRKEGKTTTKRETGATVLVKFLISLPRWNFTSGSVQSLQLLNALAECDNRLILATKYVSTIIEDKWNRFYPFTLTVTLLYGLLLCDLSFIIFNPSISPMFPMGFLGLNGFFFLYELGQIFSAGPEYFTNAINWVDLSRAALSALWAVLFIFPWISVHSIMNEGGFKYLTLVVVVLCFIRGFTYFRSFKMTRIFVYMTFTVVKEMYSFLIILWYSVLAFGLFSAVLMEFDSLGKTWTSAYNLLMGNFDNSGYGSVEWAVFTGATMTNVVIMLNLLVSILGEAYEKTQMSVHENDLHLQLTLIIEYESMMVWRRWDKSPGTVIVTCREGEDTSQGEEWQGQILQITNTLRSTMEDNFAKVNERVTAMESQLQTILSLLRARE